MDGFPWKLLLYDETAAKNLLFHDDRKPFRKLTFLGPTKAKQKSLVQVAETDPLVGRKGRVRIDVGSDTGGEQTGVGAPVVTVDRGVKGKGPYVSQVVHERPFRVHRLLGAGRVSVLGSLVASTRPVTEHRSPGSSVTPGPRKTPTSSD